MLIFKFQETVHLHCGHILYVMHFVYFPAAAVAPAAGDQREKCVAAESLLRSRMIQFGGADLPCPI
jgi:hypothetical protein